MRPTDQRQPKPGDGNGRSSPCPDDNALARYVDGRCPRGERERIEAHVARCAPCAGLLASVAKGGLVAAPETRSLTRGIWLVAAGLLIAAGLLLVGLRGSAQDDRTFDERLVALVRTVEAAAGEPLDGVPMSRQELLAQPTDGRRGADDEVWPLGVIAETAPTLRWGVRPIDGQWRVTVVDANGEDVLRAETDATRLAWPPDVPELRDGVRYALEVVGHGPFGRITLRGHFRVAGEALRTRLAALRRALQSAVSDPAGAEARVLLAHWALREDLCGFALTEARMAFEEAPNEPIVRQTLYQALLRNGLEDEAETIDPGGEVR